MCGICGIVHFDRNQHASTTALAAMNRRIVHRGPDDEGFWAEENVGLAMRRLSIIDVKTGQQPLANETRDVWIVYNGEIYNHGELRADLEARRHRYRTRSDTESIVHLYEEYGRDCVKHLRGMFAFAIWDRRKRVLFAARDRLGIKPFYYRWDGRTFLFGSEIKAVLAYPGVTAELNRNVLAEYLAFGYITGPETMFEGIQKLMPGHTLELGENGTLQIKRYWDLNIAVDREERAREYYVQSYRERLEASVRSHLMSDVPLGVFLSGGLDSSTVAALTAKIRGDRIQTFAVGYGAPGGDEERFSELSFAREVAQHIGSDHYEVRLGRDEFFHNLPRLIWHEDEPLVWPSSVALYFVARLASERVKVVLTGEGSDETLGGYTRYAWTLLNARLDGVYRAVTPSALRSMARKAIQAGPLSAALHRKLNHTFLVRDGSSWPSFYYDNFFSAFSALEQSGLLTPDALATAGNAYVGSMQAWEQSSGDLLHRLLYADINSYLIELLMKQDQMSMAASIESRVPFLDHELVEFTAKIPARYSIEGTEGKFILKRAVEDLLPREIVYRKKMGFPTPWDYWLAGPQIDELERMLIEPRSLARSLFRPEAVRRLFAEHRAKSRDHGDRIWRLLNFEIWQRVMIDGDSPEGDAAPNSATLAVPS
jgi:asparagine synthase (glutamine-hydrolysing)